MEIDLAKDLLKLFFQAPASNGILVFEDNDYLGVILKRDIEMGLAEGNFELFENINILKTRELSQVLFKDDLSRTIKIPVVDKAGTLLRIISYEEFLCQFFFDEFAQHFKIQQAFDCLEHPVIITNHFKKCIYANKKALETAEFDIQGKPFQAVLRQFDVKSVSTGMVLEKKGELFQLLISRSQSKNFSYFIYQFLKTGEPV